MVIARARRKWFAFTLLTFFAVYRLPYLAALLSSDFCIEENMKRTALIPERRKHHSTCAVVGAAGHMLGANCGREIDSMDAVFRSGFAPTEGYEKDVGSKSTYRFFMSGWLVVPREQMHKQATYFVALPTHHWDDKTKVRENFLSFCRLYKIQLQSGHTFTVGRHLYKQAAKAFGGFPTTGQLLLFYATQMCSHITAYGFSALCPELGNNESRYHYYTRDESVPENVLRRFSPSARNDFALSDVPDKKFHNYEATDTFMNKLPHQCGCDSETQTISAAVPPGSSG